MNWWWLLPAIPVSILAVLLIIGHYRLMHQYMPHIVRIFQEKPLFILPFGQPVDGAEEIILTTEDGLQLQGCYLRALQPRKGVILFGLEFGSNRWSCVPYTDFLRNAGYDIFTFEMRGQGNSPAQEGYEPIQWVTDFELTDFRTALAYLKSRPDRDPKGIGFFGLSKGGSAGMLAAAEDPFVRCLVTDGAFATLGTMVPYMKQWVHIYAKRKWLALVIPTWYYRMAAQNAIERICAERHCHYPILEEAMMKLAPRPLLMIHGGADNYIKPEMAENLFDQASEPKEFWLVEGAKHNQSMNLAGPQYFQRVQAFFDRHLADLASTEKAA